MNRRLSTATFCAPLHTSFSHTVVRPVHTSSGLRTLTLS